MRLSLALAAIDDRPQQCELRVPPDHRRAEACHATLRRTRCCAGGVRSEQVGPHGHRLPLERQRAEVVEPEAAGLACGALGHDDLARLRRLLEPGGHVDGVACDHPQIGAWLGRCEDLAGAHTDAQPEPHAVCALEPFVQAIETVLHRQCATQRPGRVVLVRARDAEQRHHGVADELLHDATLGLDGGPHLVEEGVHDRRQLLRIELLAHRGTADTIGEEHRHDLALIAHG